MRVFQAIDSIAVQVAVGAGIRAGQAAVDLREADQVLDDRVHLFIGAAVLLQLLLHRQHGDGITEQDRDNQQYDRDLDQRESGLLASGGH